MKRGQSLLEVVIALGIFVVGVTTALSLILGQRTLSQNDRTTLRATSSASEGLEAARHIRNRDWLELAPGAHGLTLSGDRWIFAGTSDTAFGITRTVTVSAVDDTTRDVTSTATWTTPTGVPRTLSLRSRLKDWRSIGAPSLSGDWTRPVTLGTVDLGPGVQANGIAVRSRIVYIAGSASAEARPDFFVVDATNGASPVLIGSLNTGPGLNEVAISGNYAYVASQEDEHSQLQIIDITNPASPILVSSFRPPGIGTDEAWSVAVVGTTVYLGLDRTSGPEFHIIDAANPAAPVHRGSFEINSDVLDIMVRGSQAYLATERDDRELMILNVSNPASITLTGRFDAPGGSEDGQGLDVHDDVGVTYFVRDVGGNHTDHHEFHIVNTTNPASPTMLGSLDIPHTLNAVQTVDYLAFLATTNSTREFQAYRIDDPANIRLWSFLNFPQMATDLAYERNVVYVAVRSNDALRIITSQ